MYIYMYINTHIHRYIHTSQERRKNRCRHVKKVYSYRKNTHKFNK